MLILIVSRVRVCEIADPSNPINVCKAHTHIKDQFCANVRERSTYKYVHMRQRSSRRRRNNRDNL